MLVGVTSPTPWKIAWEAIGAPLPCPVLAGTGLCPIGLPRIRLPTAEAEEPTDIVLLLPPLPCPGEKSAGLLRVAQGFVSELRNAILKHLAKAIQWTRL